MWLELGVPRPGANFGREGPPPRIWINTDHIVRAEFTQEGPNLLANVITTKPGGSDRTVFKGDDAERLRIYLNREANVYRPLLDYELAIAAEQKISDDIGKPAKKGKN